MKNDEAINYLENMKWLKGYDNTMIGDKPLVDIIDGIITLLKEQEVAYQGAEELLWQKMILFEDAIKRLKEQEKEIKALRLLIEWATDCGFGFDQLPEEYEQYKDEITNMKYIEGMIHVAKKTLEDHGAFEGQVKGE